MNSLFKLGSQLFLLIFITIFDITKSQCGAYPIEAEIQSFKKLNVIQSNFTLEPNSQEDTFTTWGWMRYTSQKSEGTRFEFLRYQLINSESKVDDTIRSYSNFIKMRYYQSNFSSNTKYEKDNIYFQF